MYRLVVVVDGEARPSSDLYITREDAECAVEVVEATFFGIEVSIEEVVNG